MKDLLALFNRYMRPKLATPPTTNTPHRIVQKLVNFAWEKLSVNMMSSMRPMAYGTPIVMEDDTTRQPIDANINHFSSLASDRSRTMSDFVPACVLAWEEATRRNTNCLLWRRLGHRSRLVIRKHRSPDCMIGRHVVSPDDGIFGEMRCARGCSRFSPINRARWYLHTDNIASMSTNSVRTSAI